MNPTKVSELDRHRAEVTAELARHGWAEPLWLETTAEDPGVGMAKQAVSEGAELVFASGGDGTVRACAEGLMGTQVPMAILPAGTGNLLARNLKLPTALEDAVRTGVEGETRALDLGMIDGRPFTVMAGIGLDASMADSTSDGVKAKIGWLAYVGGLVKHLGDHPFQVTLCLDGRTTIRRRAMMVLIGNVGQLQGGLRLLPDAEPDDGRLDILILAPRTPMDWLRVVGHVMTRSQRYDRRAERYTAERAKIDVEPAVLHECDGDPIGLGSSMSIETRPGALLLRTPREKRG
ncbi:diacylglycerol/lipid kinase family protein [Sphaerisporangium corydalis]|uniref:Diacylglycerol/lipid kinase family protein n=1 Tax=Sphaerisporangium corydalis TaxID=1441875 RepID=A0ABV9EMC1_9ACTN|nr:diacylglycerol kinase family protein [Sphaerisporangium corydalis]